MSAAADQPSGDADLLAASLRADTADLAQFAELLARRLEGTPLCATRASSAGTLGQDALV